jgi:hypothetical protein
MVLCWLVWYEYKHIGKKPSTEIVVRQPLKARDTQVIHSLLTFIVIIVIISLLMMANGYCVE